MEKEINEQTELKSHTAEAEEGKGESRSDVSLGKFKDVNALLEAYNSLQSEFTKRCQKLKELEARVIADDKVIPSEKESDSVQSQQDTTFMDKEQVLKEYLLDILGKKPKAIVLDGQGVGAKAPTSKPTTIGQAGNVAKEYFQKQSN